MTRAPFFRPLALAAALAALGAGPAHAMSDWQRECQRGTYEINPYIALRAALPSKDWPPS